MVSKQTAGADQLLVASTGSMVAGNDPGKGACDDFTLVALLGQVNIWVHGSISSRDFIVPSGDNDGTGIAVALERGL
jgi:hypothetical protein